MTSHFADAGFARRARHARPARPVAGLAVAGTALAVGFAALCSEQAVANGPVVCPFRLMTGLPCPGCGMTRAWVSALHGDAGRAVAENPFVLVTLPLAVFFVVSAAASLVRGRPAAGPAAFLRGLTRTRSRRSVMWTVVAGWIAFGIVRATLVATGQLAY